MTQSIAPAATAWHSPGQIFRVGHRMLADFFAHAVQVQEKADGSFFAFGLFPEIDHGEGPLRIRSKGAVMHPDAPEALFRSAVQTVKDLQDKLHPGWQYRGEVLAKPKHNALAYDRIPKGSIILFDILRGEEDFLPYDELMAEANRLGLEVVPRLAIFGPGECTTEKLLALMDRTSILGGQKIEGVVVKPLVPLFGLDKKLLMAKLVSAAFKEVHGNSWKEANPGKMDIVLALVEKLTTPARWQKALIHLREQGKIEGSLRDIGLLIREVPIDVMKEEEDYIKEALFKWAKPHITRGVTRGLPDWYKELLLKEAAELELADEVIKEIIAEEAKGG